MTTRPPMRGKIWRILLVVGLVFALMILVAFGVWGDQFDSLFTSEENKRLFGHSVIQGGIIGMLLLVSDLFLPIPTTVIIGGMGAVMGPAWAILFGWMGLTISGLVGYGFARWGKRGWVDRQVPLDERLRYSRWFDRWGGLTIIITRFLPILPEVFSVLAGLGGMHLRHFTIAVSLGSLPPAIVYAQLGAVFSDNPMVAIAGFVLVSVASWFGFLAVQKRAS